MTTQEASHAFTRFAISAPVRYRRVPDRRYRATDGWTRDLSTRGAWVELPERLTPGNTLAIEMDTPDGQLAVVAHVAWAWGDLRDAPYLHGLRFTGVTAHGRDRLRALVERTQPRVAVRLYCSLPVTCRMHGVGATGVPGVIRDLGEAGVGIRLPRVVPPGTLVRLSAPTRHGSLTADAEVVWADPPGWLPPGVTYRHGLRFRELDPRSDLPLRALLEGVQ